MGTHLLQVPSHWAFSLGLKTLWGLFYCFTLTDETTGNHAWTQHSRKRADTTQE